MIYELMCWRKWLMLKSLSIVIRAYTWITRIRNARFETSKKSYKITITHINGWLSLSGMASSVFTLFIGSANAFENSHSRTLPEYLTIAWCLEILRWYLEPLKSFYRVDEYPSQAIIFAMLAIATRKLVATVALAPVLKLTMSNRCRAFR